MSSIIGLADELAAAAGRLDQAAPPVTIRPPAAGRTIRTTGLPGGRMPDMAATLIGR